MSSQRGAACPAWLAVGLGQDGVSVHSAVSLRTASMGMLPRPFPKEHPKGDVSRESCRVAPSQGMLWEGASHPTASKTVKKSIWTTWNHGHSAIQVQKLNPRRTLWEERGDLSNFTPRDE